MSTPKRKALSKKLRFEIFKRDGFVCQYCGNTPPGIVLEIDHIIPVASGGENTEDNLIASCFDCNRGKGARSLDICPESIEAKKNHLAEKRAQLKAFERLQKKEKQDLISKAEHLSDHFQAMTGQGFSESFKINNYKFIRLLPIIDLENYLELSVHRFSNDPEIATSYYCGICWNQIRSRGLI